MRGNEPEWHAVQVRDSQHTSIQLNYLVNRFCLKVTTGAHAPSKLRTHTNIPLLLKLETLTSFGCLRAELGRMGGRGGAWPSTLKAKDSWSMDSPVLRAWFWSTPVRKPCTAHGHILTGTGAQAKILGIVHSEN